MVYKPVRSWRVRIDEPEDLHLALYVRDASGLTVPGSPGTLRTAPRLTGLVPVNKRCDAVLAWHRWWGGLLTEHQQVVASQREPHLTPIAPPDFLGLRCVTLQVAAARCWQEGVCQCWEQPPTAELFRARPEAPIGGVRGDLIAATMAAYQARLVQNVVSEVERSRSRKAGPFGIMLDMLDVEGSNSIQVTPNYTLVPIGLAVDSIRYH